MVEGSRSAPIIEWKGEKEMKTLICYFTASGETKKAAEKLSALLLGDLYEIAAVPAYSEADLNWRDPQSRSSVLMADEFARPAIRKDYPHLDDYDRLLIGFPIWWGVEPREVDTFLDEVKPSLPLYVFATSGGSPIKGGDVAFKDPLSFAGY